MCREHQNQVVHKRKEEREQEKVVRERGRSNLLVHLRHAVAAAAEQEEKEERKKHAFGRGLFTAVHEEDGEERQRDACKLEERRCFPEERDGHDSGDEHAQPGEDRGQNDAVFPCAPLHHDEAAQKEEAVEKAERGRRKKPWHLRQNGTRGQIEERQQEAHDVIACQHAVFAGDALLTDAHDDHVGRRTEDSEEKRKHRIILWHVIRTVYQKNGKRATKRKRFFQTVFDLMGMMRAMGRIGKEKEGRRGSILRLKIYN